MNEYARYQFYFNIFQFVFTCGVGFAAWWRTREEAIKAQFDKAKTDRDEQCSQHRAATQKLADKYDALKDDLRDLPSKDDIKRVHERLDRIQGSVQKVDGELVGIKNNVGLLLEAHLNGGKQ